MKEICIVHLVRAQNGIEPFGRFVGSYRNNFGSTDHDLLVVFKGFKSSSEKIEHLKMLAALRHYTFDVPDVGFDITAYFAVFSHYAKNYRFFCFLNSYSVIQDTEWLGKLYYQISRPGIGLVGASGSWNSHRGGRAIWRSLVSVAIHNFRQHKEKPVLDRLILSVDAVCQHGLFLINISEFPNYHLRTNAFMISSELMKRIKFANIKSKMDAYRFESGKNGLTRQIIQMGKIVLVVGRDGNGYEMQHWNESHTFCQDDQENLLVSDNQTREYQDGDAERRKYLSGMAWHGNC